MARAHPQFGLRPFLPADAPLLADIFRASVAELTGDDYNQAQQEAWAATADDEDEFGKRLTAQLTLVSLLNGSPVAFASLREPDEIDMLYVHPAVGGQGVASQLLDALEKLAVLRGAKRLTTDASDTARDFFTKKGYVAKQRNTRSLGGEWLVNTTMEKSLSAGAGET
jgi:putative acetyltransferase